MSSKQETCALAKPQSTKTQATIRERFQLMNRQTVQRLTRGTVAAVASIGMLASIGLSGTPAHADAGEEIIPLVSPPATVDTFVGQSVQVRKDANGNPDSNLMNFRWATTQINAESLNQMATAVPIPMSQSPMLRSLTGPSHNPDKTDDGVIFDFPDVDGIDTYRTLNLWPEDRQTPADVKAEFTLDGEPIQAQDLVGKGGVVTATYTVTNHTLKDTKVKYQALDGKFKTKTIKTSQPMVAIATQHLPQTWGQFNAGSGVVGADGRGAYQTQWIGLPFTPLSDTATSKFGWTAVIPEGEGMIPSLLINVAPLYIPADDKKPKESKSSSAGSPPGAAQIGAGAGIAADGATEFIQGISDLVGTIGTAKGAIGASMPAAISKTTTAVEALQKTLTPKGGSKLPTLPEVVSSLKSTTRALDSAAAQLRQNGNNGEIVQELQRDLDIASAGVKVLDGYVGASNDVIKRSDCKQTTDLPIPIPDPVCVAEKEVVDDLYDDVDQALKTISSTLDDVSSALPAAVGNAEAGAIEDVSSTLKEMIVQLEDLQIFLTGTLIPQITGVSDGFNAIVASISSGVDKLKEGAPSAAGEIGGGVTTLGSGLGTIGGGARELIAFILTMATAGEEVLKRAESAINDLKADFAGLLQRAHESPLPYGGGEWTVYQPKDKPEIDVENVSQAILSNGGVVPAEYKDYVQPTTELFGAYQFMIDPADSNKPDTLLRILIGVVMILTAGLAVPYILRRRVGASK